VSDEEARVAEELGQVRAMLSVTQERLRDAEHTIGHLMNLYVATSALHGALDPFEVQTTIGDIVVNMIGGERFAVLLRTTDGCEVIVTQGLDPVHRLSARAYAGGEPLVDATLADGKGRLGTRPGEPLAVVPLVLAGQIAGALVIVKLLDHKPRLVREDQELLDLLREHAAPALMAARLYARRGGG
jgi:hypothetical protein